VKKEVLINQYKKNEKGATMISFTPEAKAYILNKGGELYLEYMPMISGDIPFREAPTPRSGRPHNPAHYQRTFIDGVTLLVPRDLPDIPLQIKLGYFLWFSRLVLEGWRHA
jgi:hypothetical protein